MHRIVRLGVGHNMLELWHCPFESVKSPACQFANQTDITCSVYRSHRNACVASQLELDCSSWDAKEPPSLVQSKLPATGPPYELLCALPQVYMLSCQGLPLQHALEGTCCKTSTSED